MRMSTIRHIHRKPQAQKRVVVAMRMATSAGQQKLNGIFDFLGPDRHWHIVLYRTKPEFTPEVVRSELAHGADGFIVGIPDVDDALAELTASHVPVVMANVTGGGIERRNDGKVVLLKNDSAEIGREAANTLLSEGVYKSYGYAGYRTDDDWSRERGRAFRDTLDAAGFVGRMFDMTHFADKLDDKATMVKWLRDLPKPCGILAACDDRAFEILDICREIGVKVPAEIGVLGVNNDLLLCENAEPRLSSVQPDFIGEGRLAAEMLEAMMSGLAVEPQKRVMKVGVRMIVHRESTRPQSQAGRFVQKVLSFINREALKGIGVEDVARRFKVSRSLLELRFSELQHESVYEAMLRIRLDEVKKRLAATDDSIAKITAACGWAHPDPPKRLFKKRFGVSMREYRARCRGVSRQCAGMSRRSSCRARKAGR